MSALTKILIIIVSILVFVSCTVVVAYVGNATNEKERADQLANDLKVLEANLAALSTDIASKESQLSANQQVWQTKVAELTRSKSDLEVNLRTSERNTLESERTKNNFIAELTALRTTIQHMDLSLQKTQTELVAARTSSLKDRTDLTQLTDTLYQRIVEIQNLEVQVKRLLEEKTVLEETVTAPVATAPIARIVTPEINKAVPADPEQIPAKAGLSGYIIEVKGGLATVSIGAADGVKKNDILHVYRGGDFICDIAITNVDTNKSAGVIELEQQRPRIGDTTTTEF